MKGKNEDTTNTTNTLKGIAISAVLMNHYLNLNVSRDYVGFGNLWISVFFILSGYGLSRSLDRRFETTIYSKELFLFYYERFIRIFPLLWLAWFIELIVKGGHLSPWILSGIHAKGHYWFIPALLQCYILSPWIYLGIRKKPFIFVAILITAFVTVNFLLLNNHIDHVIIKSANFICSKWRGMYFLYIVLFVFGFLIPFFIPLEKTIVHKKKIVYSILFWFFIFFMTMFMVLLKYYIHNRFAFLLVPLLPIALLCIYSLVFSIENQLFGFLGRISYTIYLFHVSYYILLSKYGWFPKNSIQQFIMFLLLFPFFVFFCSHLDRFGGYLYRKLRFLPLFTAAQPGAAVDR